MKAKKYLEELQAKTTEELAEELVSAKKELFNLRFQNATNQLQNTARITEVRKNIARIQTVMTSKANG
ncbi:MAG: 50S ribosomal protein L29 [Lachnospiraceae bacterium]|nr:50S ribosomal protein L29 [Lachnospiraceae bacterium]